jgi:hypothetical protein
MAAGTELPHVPSQVPDMLRARVDEGEEVRVLDDLPTRLFVIRGSHAILPEPLGFADEPHLLLVGQSRASRGG